MRSSPVRPHATQKTLRPRSPAPVAPPRTGVWAVGAVLVALVVVRLVAHGPTALLTLTGVLAMCVLAYANGANDVSKGIATLVGAGVTDYRRAIGWGVLCTGVGAVLSLLVAQALVATFSAGLLTHGAHFGATAALAVLVGAIGWVLLATRTGLPVSTTHAITGAIVGVGVVSLGTQGVAWGKVVQKIALPLVASPVLALVLGLSVSVVLRLVPRQVPLAPVHWLSSGATSLARGLNDTPKIVALGAGFVITSGATAIPLWVFLAVAASMVGGGWRGGQRVTRTLAEKVTRLDDREGFAANVATAFLVTAASNLGLPVSTTHVSSGAIIGVGLRRGWRAVQWRTIRDMALAWLVTIPVAAAVAIAAYLAVR